MYKSKLSKILYLSTFAFAFLSIGVFAESPSIPLPDNVATRTSPFASRAAMPLAAGTLEVCKTGCAYSTIQSAIDAAGSGSTVNVGPGVYNEVLSISKPIALIGQSGSAIRPDHSTPLLIGGGTLRAVILVTSNGVTVQGFEIDGTASSANYGIYVYNSDGVSIIGNSVHGFTNSADNIAGVGVLFFGWTDSVNYETIQANTIFDCPRMGVLIGGQEGSSAWYLSNGNTVNGNNIYNTWTGPTEDKGQAALTIIGAQNNNIAYNNIHDNYHQVNGYSLGYGIYLLGSASPASTITHNTLYSNVQGIALVSDGISGTMSVNFGSASIATPVVQYNSIFGNTLYGLRADLNNPSFVTDATRNWWGSSSGPGSSVYGYATTTPFFVDSAMTTLSDGSNGGVCADGSTQACTYCSGTNQCSGAQTCISGNWGTCGGGTCSCIVGQCGASSCDGSTQASLRVSISDKNGISLDGYYTVLYQNGATASTGFSPATFSLNIGQQYSVEPQDYGDYSFDHWNDTGSTTRSRQISITSDSQITAIYKSLSSPPSNGTGDASTVSVKTDDIGENAINGLYTVLYQNSAVIGTGFSTANFNVVSGQEYIIEVQDYGQYRFNHWSDTGSTSRRKTFTAGAPVTFTAVYSTGQASQSTISISTTDGTNPINGYYTTLWQNGKLINSGFSPTMFSMSSGQYQVAVSDYGQYAFDHWSDGTTSRYHGVSGSSSQNLQAVYRRV